MAAIGTTDKSTKAELEQFQGYLKSLGYAAKRNTQTITITDPNLGSGEAAVFFRTDNNPAGIRLALAAMRAKCEGQRASADETDKEDDTMPDKPDSASQDSAGVPSVVSLEDQIAQITTGMPDTTVAQLVERYVPAFTYPQRGDGTTYVLSDYARLKESAKQNPPFGDSADAKPDNWTAEQRSARQAFTITYAWERKARALARENGNAPSATPRGNGASATAKPKNASASTKQDSPITIASARYGMAFSVLSQFDSGMAVGDALAILSDRYAGAITVPFYAPDERDVTSRAVALAGARAGALSVAKNIPDRVISMAQESAQDIERDVWILIVGSVWETLPLSETRMRQRYADVRDAWLYAVARQDGTLYRYASPELLTVDKPAPASQPSQDSASTGTIPPSIVASLTPIASQDTTNVVNAETASGMTASQDSASQDALSDARDAAIVALETASADSADSARDAAK